MTDEEKVSKPCDTSFLCALDAMEPFDSLNTLPGVEPFPANAQNGPMMEHWAEEMGLGAGLQVNSRFQFATLF